MSSVTARRRPPQGGYARGEETRRRVVTTALRLFAERGYEGVSTREIAAEAAVNPPALQYYFDSKDGLYRACVEMVADGVRELIEPTLRRAEQLLADDASDAVLIDAYCAVIEPLIGIVFEEDRASWSPFLSAERDGCGNNPTFAILQARLIDRLDGVFAALIGRLSGEPADAAVTRLRAMGINGQFLTFHSKRGQLQPFSPELARVVKVMVVDQTRVLLNHLVVSRVANRP